MQTPCTVSLLSNACVAVLGLLQLLHRKQQRMAMLGKAGTLWMNGCQPACPHYTSYIRY
jgi:hypothetical protein